MKISKLSFPLMPRLTSGSKLNVRRVTAQMIALIACRAPELHRSAGLSCSWRLIVTRLPNDYRHYRDAGLISVVRL